MEFLHRFSRLCFFGAIGALLASCQKENIDNNDAGYALKLSANKIGEAVHLSWSEISHSSFEHYIIVRSAIPISDMAIPTVGIVDTIEISTDTSYQDYNFQHSKFIYYKVYAGIGDRFLSSQSVKVVNDESLLDIKADKAVFDKKNNRLFILDNSRSYIYRYNYETAQLEDSLNILVFKDVSLAIGYYGETTELYISNNMTYHVEIFNALNLSHIATLPVNDHILSMDSGNSGLLFLSTNFDNKKLSTYRRSDLALVDFRSTYGHGTQTTTSVVAADGSRVAHSNSNSFQLFNVDASGDITQVRNGLFGFQSSNPLPKIAAKDDGNLCITDAVGTIVDTDISWYGRLSNNPAFIFNDFEFSATGDSIWAARKSLPEIMMFSVQDISLLATIKLNYEPLQFVRDDDSLVILGISTDGATFSHSFIGKIKI